MKKQVITIKTNSQFPKDWNVQNLLPDNENKNIDKEKIELASKEDENKNTCRICYSNDNEEHNPLFNSCACSGGIKYIHIECL